MPIFIIDMIKPPDLPNFEMDERMADSMDLDNANVNPSSDDGSCSEYSTGIELYNYVLCGW